LGDVVGSVSLNFGTPADMVDIRASLAISEKGSFLAWRLHYYCVSKENSILVSDLLVRRSERSRNSSQKTLPPPLKHDGSCLAQRHFYDWVEIFRSGRTNVTVVT